jgi:glutamine amidotransferase
MQSRITIIDYGMGNLRSVQKKFDRIGVTSNITSSPNEVYEAQKLVLPGVGHFANGVSKLKEFGIWDVLNDKVLVQKTPILGICLGMQLMASTSEEGNVSGLNWINAEVVRFNVSDKLKYKVPHMGWNNVIRYRKSILFNDISNDALFYFVHSYHIKCKNEADILATSEYDCSFTSAIHNENIYGTQFHPEKSHDTGEKLLMNFAAL